MDLIPFGGFPFGSLDPFEGFSVSPSFFSSFPKIDVKETEKEIIVEADIPGVDPKKVDVEVSGGTLRLSAKIEKEKESTEKGYYRKERSTHSFQRVVPLPAEVLEDGVKASVKNGTLTIRFPKKHAQEHKMKKIPIEEI